MQGKVEICGVNTSKLQTLSNAEMMRLIERSQQGDMDARSLLPGGGKSQTGPVCGAAVSEPRREPGRPVSGGLHRPAEGNRQL